MIDVSKMTQAEIRRLGIEALTKALRRLGKMPNLRSIANLRVYALRYAVINAFTQSPQSLNVA